MRIAVTGGAGFIGGHLVSALLRDGHEVLVYDNCSASRKGQLPWRTQVRFVPADILDVDRLQNELNHFQPELVYHLAALHYIPYCDRHSAETMRVNVEGTLNLMAAASAVPALKGVVFASSMAVYPPGEQHHAENEEPQPWDIYGLTKHLAEQTVGQYARQAHISHLALRLANIYGPGETTPHVIPEVLEQLLEGRATLHVGRTDPFRDFLYVGDLTHALLKAIPLVTGEEVHEVLNLGSGHESQVQKVIELLCQLSGGEVRIVADERRVRPVDRMHLRANIERARHMLAWDPRHDLRSGLEMTFRSKVSELGIRAAAAHA
jgi:UDP-glucose 4-epimerase